MKLKHAKTTSALPILRSAKNNLPNSSPNMKKTIQHIIGVSILLSIPFLFALNTTHAFFWGDSIESLIKEGATLKQEITDRNFRLHDIRCKVIVKRIDKCVNDKEECTALTDNEEDYKKEYGKPWRVGCNEQLSSNLTLGE